MEILDFTDSDFGLLVTYSEHYLENSCIKKNKRKVIGIIVDKKFYEDEISGVICYPVVHFEGRVSDSIVHPANLKPYRKNIKLPTKIVSNNS